MTERSLSCGLGFTELVVDHAWSVGLKGYRKNVRMRPELGIALATFNEMETGLYEDCQARFGLVFLLAVSQQIKKGRR